MLFMRIFKRLKGMRTGTTSAATASIVIPAYKGVTSKFAPIVAARAKMALMISPAITHKREVFALNIRADGKTQHMT